jgi:DNA-binding NarL/FixJ family response regulator
MQTTSINAAEQSIINLIRQGKANKEIAEYFKISEVAVKNRIHRLLKKYCCKNRVQLALIVISNGDAI